MRRFTSARVRTVRSSGGLAIAVILVARVMACKAVEAPDQANSGNPGGLLGAQLPTVGNNTPQGDAGSQMMMSDASCAGDASFANIDTQYFASTCGTSSCHGGVQPPSIKGINPSTDYENLTTYALGSSFYVTPGANAATNPVGMGCNLVSATNTPLIGTSVCDAPSMPQSGTVPSNWATPIVNWLQCGAPNN